MKRAPKILAISFLILLALLLCSCQEAETDNIIPPSNQPTETELRTPEYDENGKYIGFSDIPDNYTVNDAINDGCIVIETIDAGVDERGLKLTETPTKVGYEKFTAFCEKAEQGENAFLRVAHFISEQYYYTDLYYHDGKFTVFTNSYELGISEGESYSLLRRLESNRNGKTHSYYVLTDSTEFDYHYASQVMFSSVSTADAIPFYALRFVIYFE
ncbi:MAG: hypothetical protein E7634_03070 [Ruminococcaceae bacterium]|nr:hypothetical protein [Oscillospiraceae bacterium]